MNKIFILILLLISISYSQNDRKYSELKYWMTDSTNTLTSSQLQDLNYRLKTYQDSTSNQLVGLMIPTLNDYPLEYYSIEVATQNKIGTKKHENGVLVLVVKNDHKARIEVGYGLEGALPDALASSIIRNVMIPQFRNDNYYAGISDGMNAIIKTIAGEYVAEDNKNSDNNNSHHGSFIVILMIIFFLFNFFRRGGRRGSGGFIYYGGGFGSGGSGGFSGGGFGGGGFSGGGGSFGGGGASGGW